MKTAIPSLILSAVFSQAAAASELLEKSEQVQRLYQENIATFAIYYAEAAEARDINRILQLSCMQLRLTIDYLDPGAYSAEDRIAEVTALKTKGQKLKRQLESRSLCE